jgi:hypothetical protein
VALGSSTAAKRGRVLPSNHGIGVLCLVSLEKPRASSESQGRGRNPLGIWIAGLSAALRLIHRSFFAIQRHILAALRVPLVTSRAILDIAGVENP